MGWFLSFLLVYVVVLIPASNCFHVCHFVTRESDSCNFLIISENFDSCGSFVVLQKPQLKVKKKSHRHLNRHRRAFYPFMIKTRYRKNLPHKKGHIQQAILWSCHTRWWKPENFCSYTWFSMILRVLARESKKEIKVTQIKRSKIVCL